MKPIQSLQRAFDILEALSDEPTQCISLADIARRTGLHPATCAHLLATMVDRGYAAQAGRRKGYSLGSMAHYLIRNDSRGGELTARAEPLMAELAERLGEWVVLTAMAGSRRLVLVEVNGSSRSVQLDRSALHVAEKAYDSASIWLFLAHMAPDARERFFLVHGEPDLGPGVVSVAEHLETIREDGFATYEDAQGEVAKVAFPVWRDEGLAAAVGVHLPAFRFRGEHKSSIMQGLEALAEKLGRSMKDGDS